jgi:hypothetical protein
MENAQTFAVSWIVCIHATLSGIQKFLVVVFDGNRVNGNHVFHLTIPGEPSIHDWALKFHFGTGRAGGTGNHFDSIMTDRRVGMVIAARGENEGKNETHDPQWQYG